MTQVPVRLACKALLASLARPPSSATWRVERHFGAVLVRSQDQVLIRPVSGRVGPCRRLLRRRPLPRAKPGSSSPAGWAFDGIAVPHALWGLVQAGLI